MVMGKVVSKAQNTFVEGRQILDAVLVANEVLDSVLKGKEGAVMCKLDIEKAYDHVEWSFVVSVMSMMGFGEKWIRWIKWCISTVSFSVLVNGSSSGFFQSSRGLRQEDPLSLYLFVMVMEAFSSLLRSALDGGFVSACKARSRGGEGVKVSHLLFADDTLVFCGASKEQLLYLSWILMWFEAMSGLRINLDKSELIPVGYVENAEELAATIGCKVGSLPTTYLGLPLGAPYRSLAVWDGVEERMRKKLARWKSQYISKGGRITLIRSTLVSMPIYYMSMLSMPRKVRLRLERIQRDFLWRGGLLRGSLILLGGIWFALRSGKVWGGARGWSSKEARDGYGVGLWKNLRKEWEVDAWVKDVWRCNEGGGSWSPLFSRPLNDWELDEVCRFFVALNEKRIQQAVDDRAIWKVSVQPRVRFFGWEATWGKALTLDQLQKRGWALANGCYLCQRHEESIDHVLLHCEKARTLWALLFSMFGVQWVLLTTVKEMHLGWNGTFVGTKRKGVWRASPLCLFWTVWKARNKVAFEEEELSIQRLRMEIICTLSDGYSLHVASNFILALAKLQACRNILNLA
ncbi:LINE-1 reverse transcriptase-like [Vitis vinifera]|uniref:LINE-1 reverse transcriptase-like n=1 Tax=Vitis vinifera TaxID=29760 RepID=A0A438GM04_VITVI|nr:LINE-1 reverse transcriptase-like [Vitis vinifera]